MKTERHFSAICPQRAVQAVSRAESPDNQSLEILERESPPSSP